MTNNDRKPIIVPTTMELQTTPNKHPPPLPLNENTPLLLVGSPHVSRQEEEIRDSNCRSSSSSSSSSNSSNNLQEGRGLALATTTLPPHHHHQSANENDNTAPSTKNSGCCCCCCCGCFRLSGTFRVGIGAAFFAATNAAATALYRRNGSTVVSLYIIRSPIIYITNAMLVSIMNYYYNNNNNQTNNTNGNNGNGEIVQVHQETTIDVLLLRTGSREASYLTLLRSLLNSTKAVLLSIGFVYLTYADAFVIFKGIAVCGTIIVARKFLGTNEKLAAKELICGIFVIIGILCIAPPTSISSIFDKDDDDDDDDSETTPTTATENNDDDNITNNYWVPRQTAGVVLVIIAGLLSAFSGTLMRLLSANAGPHKTSPYMLLSYLMVVFFIVNSFVAIVISPLVVVVDNTDNTDNNTTAWSWTKLVWPQDKIDYILIATNCICTLGGHLATASGYQTTRAGIVAFLQLTEIPWVYMLDVLALNESTTPMKSIGSGIVFVSAVAVALIRQQQQQQQQR